jgi:DNA polymerase elongation subunit (family B)
MLYGFDKIKNHIMFLKYLSDEQIDVKIPTDDKQKKTKEYEPYVGEFKIFWNELVKVFLIQQNFTIRPVIIYGDTDSNFINFNIKDDKGELMKNQTAVAIAIELGKLSSVFIKHKLPYPHKLNYEKTMWPFCILAKKRYIGNLYEDDNIKYKLKYMGIALKRRDNVELVKIIMRSIIAEMMRTDNLSSNDEGKYDSIIKIVINTLQSVLKGEYPMKHLTLSKTLKAVYKNRTSHAHVVLADRIAERDPGNAPALNDRVKYVFIITDHKGKVKQGLKVEDPEYLVAKGLKIDYLHYIENQIMNPVVGLLEPILPSVNDVFYEIINKERDVRNGIQTLEDTFGVKVKKQNRYTQMIYAKEANEDKKYEDMFEESEDNTPAPVVKSEFCVSFD